MGALTLRALLLLLFGVDNWAPDFWNTSAALEEYHVRRHEDVAGYRAAHDYAVLRLID